MGRRSSVVVAVSRAAAEGVAYEGDMVDAESSDGVWEDGDGVVVSEVELAEREAKVSKGHRF